MLLLRINIDYNDGTGNLCNVSNSSVAEQQSSFRYHELSLGVVGYKVISGLGVTFLRSESNGHLHLRTVVFCHLLLPRITEIGRPNNKLSVTDIK